MQTLRVGEGYSADFTVTIRDRNGVPVVDTYTGEEALALVISDLLGVELTLAGSTVTWTDPAAGTVLLHIDDADTASTIAVGSHGLTISITPGFEPYEAYRAVLKIEPRASAPIIVP